MRFSSLIQELIRYQGMKTIISVVLLTFAMWGWTQSSETKYRFEDPIHSFAIFVTPTSLFNPLYPSLHAGTEMRTGDWGFVGESGMLLSYSLYKNEASLIGLQDFRSLNRGFFLKAEFKKYIGHRFYCATNVQYLFNHYSRNDTFDGTPEITNKPNANYFCTTCIDDNYSIRKNLFGMALKMGYRYDSPNQWFMDGYFGLGFNYHSNKHSHNEDLHKYPAMADGFLMYYDSHFPGKYIFRLPSPDLGIRMGYVFN